MAHGLWHAGQVSVGHSNTHSKAYGFARSMAHGRQADRFKSRSSKTHRKDRGRHLALKTRGAAPHMAAPHMPAQYLAAPGPATSQLSPSHHNSVN